MGVSQSAFGEKLGVSRSVINNLERGVTVPSDIFLNHLCEIYRVNRQWLETGEGEMFSNASDGEMEKILRATQDSPAMRSLMLTWFQLNDVNKRALETIVENYVAEYKRQKADSSKIDHRG